MGYIYSDPRAYSYSDSIGSADRDGYIYNTPRPYLSGGASSDCIGYVDSDGYIYQDPRPYLSGGASSDCIGYIDRDGYIYTPPAPISPAVLLPIASAMWIPTAMSTTRRAPTSPGLPPLPALVGWKGKTALRKRLP